MVRVTDKICIPPYRPVYPTPAALITSVDARGRPNIITLGEVFNVSIHKPVIIGIAIRKETYSYKLIVDQKEFTVNFPTTAMLAAVDGIGHVSGRTCDKFSTFSLTPLAATFIRAPIIRECPVNLECRLISDQEVGDHQLILGDVLAEHVDENTLVQGRPDGDRLDFFSFAFGEYWGQAGRLAKKGFSMAEKGG